MPTGDLHDCSRMMVKLADDIDTNVVQLVRKVVFTILDEVVRGTPADTGKARSNWQLSVGEPVDEVLPPYAPGKHLGIDETANAEAAIAEGERVLDTMEENDAVYIQNNVPYIELLNDGHSTQAPKLFVEAAIDRASAVIQAAKVVP